MANFDFLSREEDIDDEDEVMYKNKVWLGKPQKSSLVLVESPQKEGG